MTVLDRETYYYECPNPKCKQTSMDSSYFDIEGEEAWRLITCVDCGYQWREVFAFAFNEEVSDIPCDIQF